MKYFRVAIILTLTALASVAHAITGDMNRDGQINLVEAITALRIASGDVPDILPSCIYSGKDQWTTGTDYAECDVVSYNELLYACSVDHTSTDFIDDQDSWVLLSTPDIVPIPSGFGILGTTDVAPTGFTYTEQRIFEDSWEQKANMNTGRNDHCAEVVDGKLYVLGGYNGEPVEEYDPATDTWMTKADIVTFRRASESAEVNGKIYIIGGYDDRDYPALNLDIIEEYDPSTDTWVSKASMPTARYGAAVASMGGKVYVIGGWATGIGLTEAYSMVEVYDPTSNTWAVKTSMPEGKSGIKAEVIDGLIYVIGKSESWDTMDIYNPATDSWSTLPNIPSGGPDGVFETGVIDNKMYVIGGRGAPNAPTNSVFQYDPILGSWTKVSSLPIATERLAVGVIDGKLYAPGGDTSASMFTSSNVLQVYSPDIFYIHTKD